jgi:L-alanine-DL-glutamate epimerase-like enolase superfamily enzyme
MSEAAGWDALSRLEQRALIKLFGGGSLRRETPAVVELLRARALVDESDALSMAGLFALTLAMRREQELARSRAARRSMPIDHFDTSLVASLRSLNTVVV